MAQESHMQDTANVITDDLTPEQEDILWWEHYKKYYLIEDNGESQFS